MCYAIWTCIIALDIFCIVSVQLYAVFCIVSVELYDMYDVGISLYVL